MFHFLIEAKSATKLADAMQNFQFRGPVHDRIIAELRKEAHDREDDGSGFSGPHVLCSVSGGDRAVLMLWACDPQYEGHAEWSANLQAGLDDGGFL
jgi:hypothetical protein